MALTGQLSDMSLAELIEFFCNQRKTGRLKIDYPRGHSVFFIKEGELVDAKVGALSGAEAVYFSLTLPNAAFDFSPDVQATRRTIDQAVDAGRARRLAPPRRGALADRGRRLRRRGRRARPSWRRCSTRSSTSTRPTRRSAAREEGRDARLARGVGA